MTNSFYWVIQIRVPWVGEVMECKFQKYEIFADVAGQSSIGTLAGNALTI